MAPRPAPGSDEDPIAKACRWECKPLDYDPILSQNCFFRCYNKNSILLAPPSSEATAGPALFYSSASTAATSSLYAQMAAASSTAATVTAAALTSSSSSTQQSGVAASTGSADSFGPDRYHHPEGHPGPPPYITAASVIVPLIILSFALIAFITVIRSRRRKRKMAEEQAKAAPEMQDLPRRPSEHAYMHPPSIAPPPSTSSPGSAGTPSTYHSSNSEAPVLLSSTMDGAYFTGLDVDTSDHVSLRSEPRSDQRLYAPAGDDIDDEPPPPYRPCSVPPISREASVRTSVVERSGSTRTYRASMLGCEGSGMANPFEDPEEDAEEDVFADEAGPSRSSLSFRAQPASTVGVVERDRRSEVSDLSYQMEPTQGRSSL